MIRKMVTFLALAVSCLTAVSAAASIPDPDAPDASVDAPSWLSQRSSAQAAQSTELEIGSDAQGPSSVRTVALFVAVSALAGAALYMRKRRGAKTPVVDASTIHVVASTRLGPKASMVVATVGGRTLLLGVTETNVRKLAWLDEPAAAAADADPDAETDSGFEDEAPTLNFEGRPITQLRSDRARPRSDRAQSRSDRAQPSSDRVPRNAVNRTAVDRFDEVLRTKLSSEGSVVARVRRDMTPAEQLAEETKDVYEPTGSRRARKAELRPSRPAILAQSKALGAEVRSRAALAEARARGATLASATRSRAEARAIDAHDDEGEPARDSAFEGQIAGLSARLKGRVA